MDATDHHKQCLAPCSSAHPNFANSLLAQQGTLQHEFVLAPPQVSDQASSE